MSKATKPEHAMNRAIALLCLNALLCAATVGASVADSAPMEPVRDAVDWAAFLARQDMVCTRLPVGWHEGPFMGNGLLGAVVYIDPEQRNALRFEIGRSDVYDHRVDEADHGLRHNRMPIGYFHLLPVGTIKDGTARLDLWNAEIASEVITNRGTIRWKAFVAETEVMVVEVESSPGEEGCRFAWNPEQAISPHYLVTFDENGDDRPYLGPLPSKYRHNPKSQHWPKGRCEPVRSGIALRRRLHHGLAHRKARPETTNPLRDGC